MNEITQIEVSNIMPHPKNPRRDLGDLEELAESIRIHGVMQNLIVIDRKDAIKGMMQEYEQTPSQILTETMDKLKDSKREYVVLLGHRRLAAADEAGLETVPCIIEKDLKLNDQIALMLLENMQRNNLTIVEEAQSFQMMLDLGDTVANVAEKSGFSESTVRHRVELAKLDQKKLEKALEDSQKGGYQMTLSDLARLERVEDIRERNRILDNAMNGNQIENGVRRYIEEAQTKKHYEIIKNKIEEVTGRTLGKAPKDWTSWGDKYHTLWEIDTDRKPDAQLKKKETIKLFENLPPDAFMQVTYSEIIIAAKSGKGKRELSPEEAERKETQKRITEINKLKKKMVSEWMEWLFKIVTGERPGEKDEKHIDIMRSVYALMEQEYVYVNRHSLMAAVHGGEDTWNIVDDERERCIEQINQAPLIARMLVCLCEAAKRKDITDYRGEYGEEHARLFNEINYLISCYGYCDDMYDDLLNGSHPLYRKPEEVTKSKKGKKKK